MSDEEFDNLVHQALTDLPDEFAKALENIAILIEDEPTDEQKQLLHLRPYQQLFGLYQGVPLTKRTSVLLTEPDRITIFRKPIESVFQTSDAIKAQVRSTVFHEIGHYFGLSEEDLHRLRKKMSSDH
jgi:predicted Zn-dependent protease with MMP-like domain